MTEETTFHAQFFAAFRDRRKAELPDTVYRKSVLSEEEAQAVEALGTQIATAMTCVSILARPLSEEDRVWLQKSLARLADAHLKLGAITYVSEATQRFVVKNNAHRGGSRPRLILWHDEAKRMFSELHTRYPSYSCNALRDRIWEEWAEDCGPKRPGKTQLYEFIKALLKSPA